MIDPRAAAITAGLLSGAVALAVAAAHLVRPGYGTTVVALLTDLHPTLVPAAGPQSAAALALLALVDGAALGYAAAWIYNRVAR